MGGTSVHSINVYSLPLYFIIPVARVLLLCGTIAAVRELLLSTSPPVLFA